MLYREKLSFLCQVFQRNHINAIVIARDELLRLLEEESSNDFFPCRKILREHCHTFEENTVYKLTDAFALCYRYLVLPSTEKATLLAIGPYLPAPITSQKIMEIGEKNDLPPQIQKSVFDYYSAIPILPPDSPLWSVLHTFCEDIWKSGVFYLSEITEEELPSSNLFNPLGHGVDQIDTLVNMKTLEKRYSFENEIIHAVTTGKPHLEDLLRSSFSPELFEKRASDPLRNAKNYGVIMNTLLRKAAENGGVHPYYIDQISSNFAVRIENAPTLSEIPTLMCEMFRTYCHAVRDLAFQTHSQTVQKVLLLIDSNLSGDLSTGALSRMLGLSVGYLSTLFKKEMSQTISEYVRERRMNYAAYLLRSGEIQIQTIALHCGIMDVQYFSKLFKRQHGVSPTEYRIQNRNVRTV